MWDVWEHVEVGMQVANNGTQEQHNKNPLCRSAGGAMRPGVRMSHEDDGNASKKQKVNIGYESKTLLEFRPVSNFCGPGRFPLKHILRNVHGGKFVGLDFAKVK
ncbi:hypothetical protein E2C01_045000 [Portunus trituberculatus]|uniref:Uncharacterized protein n=1 Tax=Portunus trituberculatus TaxID=210409 RepID=A0A5B7FTK5_PORTR|nr:hypothetical protein [Portunus trituberculatus]